MPHRTFERAGMLLALLAASSCVTNPATGHTQLSLIGSDEEIALGKQEARKVAQTIGLYDGDGIEAYVREVALPMAQASERPHLPWQFHVLDDASVNAFALPGGPIYVTRGLLANVNTTAELATVLGHEIGHVTARHSVNQLSKAALANLGLGLGAMFSDTVAKYGSLLGVGLQLMFLKYSRDAEREADELGFRYALAQHWDVREMASLFETLARASDAGGGGSLPDWLSTHPNPEDRLQAVQRRLKDKKLDPARLKEGRSRYFQAVDGLVYGQNPREGFFRKETYFHPRRELQIVFPAGWKTQSTAMVAMAGSPDQDAALVLTKAKEDTSDAALAAFLAQEGVRGARLSSSPVPVSDAASAEFSAASSEGAGVSGIVSFFGWRGEVLQLLGYGLQSRVQTFAPAIRETMASVDKLTDRSILGVTPARLKVVHLDAPANAEQLAKRSDSGVGASELARINGQTAEHVFSPGPVKLVVGGLPELFDARRASEPTASE